MMRGARSIPMFTLWLQLGLVGACAPATQFIVLITSNFGPDSELSSVELLLSQRDGSDATSRRFEIAAASKGTVKGTGQQQFPITFSITRGKHDTFLLNVVGYDAQGSAIVEQRAIGTFQTGKALLLRIDLDRACEKKLCEADSSCSPPTDGAEPSACRPIRVYNADNSRAVNPDRPFEGIDLSGNAAGSPSQAGSGTEAAGSGDSTSSMDAESQGSGGTAAAENAGTGAADEARASGAAEHMDASVTGVPPCTGDACGSECTSDADCETRGLAEAQCVDSRCFGQESQCQTEEDCLARGPEYEGGRCIDLQCQPSPRWRCEVPAGRSPSDALPLTVLVLDALSLRPLGDFHIVACAVQDLTCTQPIADGRTDTDGKLALTLPADLRGYLQQTERNDYEPAMYFLPEIAAADGVLQPFPLLGSGVVDALAASLGAQLDPERGHLMLIAEDCFGEKLGGVSFSSESADESTVGFYTRDRLPSVEVQETVAGGEGGYVNFPPGTALIDVTRVSDGLHVGTAGVVVRAGFVSVVYMRPEPRR